ncbi:MAG: glycosyl transferase [Rubrivivax sp.]|nr:MAG: glycosyl transferase [Rubrivivax sp.]
MTPVALPPAAGPPAAVSGDERRAHRWRAARRVLLIRLDNLGDVLMTTPAIAAVRESLPGAHLTLLAAPSIAALAPHLPMVDEIVGFDAPWTKAGAAAADAGDPPRGWTERRLLQRLCGADGGDRERPDAAIIFTVCTQSVFPAATLCRLAGIPLVLGHARERAYGLLSDEVADTDAIGPGLRHEVRRQLDLVASVGCRTQDERLRFTLRERDRRVVRAVLREAGLAEGRPYVLFHPGASAPSRRYPADRLGEAADRIVGEDRTGRTMAVLCAGPGEVGLLAEMRRAMRSPAIVVATSAGIGELGALIADARLLVANNSGPVHLAAAVGTPVVDLYALTNPQHTPWQVASRVLSHDVPCRDCQQSVCPQVHHACLRGIAPDRIAEAAGDLLRPALGAVA